MPLCSVVAGNTDPRHPPMPFSPSVSAIRMSATLCVFRLFEDLQPELGAFGVLDPQAQDVTRVVGQNPSVS